VHRVLEPKVFVFFAIFLVFFVVKSSEPGLSRFMDFRMVADRCQFWQKPLFLLWFRRLKPDGNELVFVLVLN
jgi:hypothetical protein